MILTDEEKRMRDGAEGTATAAAMDLLIRYGDALACDRLCDVRNVAGTMTQPSPVKERLVREGGWDKAFAVINLDCDTDIEVPAMRVPTCQLQHGFGADAQGIVPYPVRNIGVASEEHPVITGDLGQPDLVEDSSKPPSPAAGTVPLNTGPCDDHPARPDGGAWLRRGGGPGLARAHLGLGWN